VPDLFNYDGQLVQLDGNGGLSPVNFADLCDLIDQHLCDVRVVQRDGVWRKEYVPFQFPQPPGPDPARGGARPDDNRKPDATVLNQIYRHELALRLPKVES
jgi:hypothetical protein